VFPQQPPQARAMASAQPSPPPPTKPPTKPSTTPSTKPPTRKPPRPADGRPAKRRQPRRWPTSLVVAVPAAIPGGGTHARVTYLTERSGGPHAGATSPPVPYTRTAVPSWLPPGWSKVVDDESKASIVPGPATNGGNCFYDSAGVVRVTRDSYDVSGCVAAQ